MLFSVIAPEPLGQHLSPNRGNYSVVISRGKTVGIVLVDSLWQRMSLGWLRSSLAALVPSLALCGRTVSTSLSSTLNCRRVVIDVEES